MVEQTDTLTRISFEEFQKLQDAADETVRYELDEGKLILTYSKTLYQSVVTSRLRRAVTDFAERHYQGIVFGGMDFRLSANTIRNPDIALLSHEQVQDLDWDRNVIEKAPVLAVETISSHDLAENTVKKVFQFLAKGSEAVWIVYPRLKLIMIHDRQGIRSFTENDTLCETRPFCGPKFTLSLAQIFDENPL